MLSSAKKLIELDEEDLLPCDHLYSVGIFFFKENFSFCSFFSQVAALELFLKELDRDPPILVKIKQVCRNLLFY